MWVCLFCIAEYAYTIRVTEKSDVYSFGVVMLELVTGKSPMSSDIGDKDLVAWAATNVEQNGAESVLDEKIAEHFKDEMCRVLRIALLCVKNLPNNRPSMRLVVKFLLDIKGENKPKVMKITEALPATWFQAMDDTTSGSMCSSWTMYLKPLELYPVLRSAPQIAARYLWNFSILIT